MGSNEHVVWTTEFVLEGGNPPDSLLKVLITGGNPSRGVFTSKKDSKFNRLALRGKLPIFSKLAQGTDVLLHTQPQSYRNSFTLIP